MFKDDSDLRVAYIPHWLILYLKVKADGTYNRQAMPQTTYLTMTYIRMGLVKGSARDLGRVATIATRYSAVRRQTANTAGVEPQILDYQTQQMKLFPAISTSYALYFTGMFVEDIYQDTMAAVKSGDTIGLPEVSTTINNNYDNNNNSNNYNNDYTNNRSVVSL